ncbi:uncharacterized protein LOC129410316 isoform X2 [Boleophthalmus pectinirostris]|uniref:uncharacterized protein LOC129410316 isoform X2 n=1 Tax=Boleophthalmus pectinirostris TaxID=150288 RepID=UPI0024302BBA|nr:uncharacterized protein LOC129410316 isoform X2 [Boleophthalmus pectinirostris]
MSDSELQELLQSEVSDDLKGVDEFLCKLQKEATAVQEAAVPMVRWKKRRNDGSLICTKPRSNRKQPSKADCSRLPQADAAPNLTEVVFTPETIEEFMLELQHALSDTTVDQLEEELPHQTSPQASSEWSKRKCMFAENWRTERPRLVNTIMANQHVVPKTCQECWSNAAVVRCRDCRPHPFLCSECDRRMHDRYPLHNREATIAGFYQPLPPTKVICSGALCHYDRLVPLEIPATICGCASSLKLKPGKRVAVVTMNGRHDLSIPELVCDSCCTTWSAGIDTILASDFWPATLNFATLFATDVFATYEDMKMAAPGLSCQAFLRMLDLRTVRFGRMGKISADTFLRSFFEWEAVKYGLDRCCKEEPFTCPACSPDMLAVSVDGNRKHYRFKSASRSEEPAIFDGVFLANDNDVANFVNYVHSKAKHCLEEVFVVASGRQPEKPPANLPASWMKRDLS